MTDAPESLRPSSRVPWTRRPSTADAFDDVDCDRLMVFVPAIMSVGLLFSFATLVRDVFPLVRRAGPPPTNGYRGGFRRFGRRRRSHS